MCYSPGQVTGVKATRGLFPSGGSSKHLCKNPQQSFCWILYHISNSKSSFCANYTPSRRPKNDTTIRKLLRKVMMPGFFPPISLNVKGCFNWGLNMVSVSTLWCQLGHGTHCTVAKVHVMSYSCSRVALLISSWAETAALMRNILRGMSSEIICLWRKQKAPL